MLGLKLEHKIPVKRLTPFHAALSSAVTCISVLPECASIAALATSSTAEPPEAVDVLKGFVL